MKHTILRLALVFTVALLAACGSAPKKDLALERVRAALEELKSDPELKGYAPLALGDAERSLRHAENAPSSDNHRIHLLYMADRRIQIARALAQREQLEREYEQLEATRNRLLVRASQYEVEQARLEAEQARLQSAATAEDAERARMQASSAQQQQAESARAAEQALQEAEQARRLAEAQAEQVALARREAELATQQADTLRRQLENMQLRQTESGVVITLGDVLFETGQAQLKTEARDNLAEVVELLQSEPDKKIRIEGHTDSVGAASTNLQLSERRAGNVRDALASHGVAGSRMTILGLGEDFPIASNETAEGRSQNRRVDVILLDE